MLDQRELEGWWRCTQRCAGCRRRPSWCPAARWAPSCPRRPDPGAPCPRPRMRPPPSTRRPRTRRSTRWTAGPATTRPCTGRPCSSTCSSARTRSSSGSSTRISCPSTSRKRSSASSRRCCPSTTAGRRGSSTPTRSCLSPTTAGKCTTPATLITTTERRAADPKGALHSRPKGVWPQLRLLRPLEKTAREDTNKSCH
ncbi:hypothetical protein FOCC_FOCC014395 [Frankliniella occidentalis]|nr:hypothetical protein FOCC_FOCC014395 [Frankliniella occidentalis]